eukprot:5601686-Pleurochrysis_carterae.AAC.2
MAAPPPTPPSLPLLLSSSSLSQFSILPISSPFSLSLSLSPHSPSLHSLRSSQIDRTAAPQAVGAPVAAASDGRGLQTCAVRESRSGRGRRTEKEPPPGPQGR